jgi:Ca2+-binding RTX toxin-like protein
VTVNLLNSAANTGDAAGDSYISVEGLVGSNFNDVLRIANTGGSIWALGGNDSVIGGNGNDDLHGQSGIDHLIGGAGADILDGGDGFDFANYSTALFQSRLPRAGHVLRDRGLSCDPP